MVALGHSRDLSLHASGHDVEAEKKCLEGKKSLEACNPAASEQRSQHARSCVHDSLLRVTAKKKYRTQAPYFYPRVKLPICNFHYNLVLKNDFYHPEERDFSLSLSLTSSTSRSF